MALQHRFDIYRGAGRMQTSASTGVSRISNQRTTGGLSVQKRRLTAVEHFAKTGSMSPLQRCSDIATLIGYDGNIYFQ
jgi:hypothetical protein